MAAVTQTQIDAAGISLELRRGGTGAPLLFIHGELGVPGCAIEGKPAARSGDQSAPTVAKSSQSCALPILNCARRPLPRPPR